MHGGDAHHHTHRTRPVHVGIAMAALAAMLTGPGNPTSAHAGGLRCGNRVISQGEHIYEVRDKCGDPDDERQYLEWRTIRVYEYGVVVERTVQVTIDEWIYDMGSNRFLRFVYFENGRLYHVRTGGRGRR
jgi:hypothetical protein